MCCAISPGAKGLCESSSQLPAFVAADAPIATNTANNLGRTQGGMKMSGVIQVKGRRRRRNLTEQEKLLDGRPHPGMRVEHNKSGGQYVVIAAGKMEKNLEPVVVYCSVEDDADIWVRPLNEFCDGRFEVVLS